jgi:two-component system sensor histidine kinase KdpD
MGPVFLDGSQQVLKRQSIPLIISSFVAAELGLEQWWKNGVVRGRLTGLTVGIVGTLVLVFALVPLRGQVAVATVTLIFIIPVIIGVVLGGLSAGLVTVVVGALLLDFFFIKPYGTLSIGSTQNWTGLAVYLIVVALVARVVSKLNIARVDARRSTQNMRRVYELSELLVHERSIDDLLVTIVRAVQNVFGFDGVSLFVLENDELKMAASVGENLTKAERAQLDPRSGLSVSIATARSATGELRTVALSSSGRPVGLLVLKGHSISDTDRDVLITFANDAALAMERTQLRELALRTTLLEEVDQLRHALMGAVSHDLRTPLATIKVASSTLVNRVKHLSSDDVHELHELIEIESDRLTRLVTNLLDMTRIEAGVLKVEQSSTSVQEFVDEAVDIMATSFGSDQIKLDVADALPHVSIDRLLMVQVLVNLLDNAHRHSPRGGTVTISCRLEEGKVVASVSDQGSGVPENERHAIFNRFISFDTGGRAGLGLTIARTFVEAHGEDIWCDDAEGGGARFSFTMVPIVESTVKDHS